MQTIVFIILFYLLMSTDTIIIGENYHRVIGLAGEFHTINEWIYFALVFVTVFVGIEIIKDSIFELSYKAFHHKEVTEEEDSHQTK